MEGDTLWLRLVRKNSFQSTPSVWRETIYAILHRCFEKFQSTPSVWRETSSIGVSSSQYFHFNPLPPYGGRLNRRLSLFSRRKFQSTPSVWRETFEIIRNALCQALFQSTPSVWRETSTWLQLESGENISIHSLRMEGDKSVNAANFSAEYFNPLPPYGGRQGGDTMETKDLLISIHSLRMEGDQLLQLFQLVFQISIHSLRMEGDRYRISNTVSSLYFNPLPPYGGRRAIGYSPVYTRVISIHSLRMEGDVPEMMILSNSLTFQSTPSVWRETPAPAVGW